MDRYNNPLYRWVSPADNMYRNGWEDIYREGVIPDTLKKVAMQFYMNGLDNAQSWAQRNQYKNLQNLFNDLRNKQIYNNYIGLP